MGFDEHNHGCGAANSPDSLNQRVAQSTHAAWGQDETGRKQSCVVHRRGSQSAGCHLISRLVVRQVLTVKREGMCLKKNTLFTAPSPGPMLMASKLNLAKEQARPCTYAHINQYVFCKNVCHVCMYICCCTQNQEIVEVLQSKKN